MLLVVSFRTRLRMVGQVTGRRMFCCAGLQPLLMSMTAIVMGRAMVSNAQKF